MVTLDGLVNYDVMTEVALRETDVAAAAEAVRAACAESPTSWGNLVLIDATSAASVEIRGSEVVVVPLDAATARSNHHVVLGHHELQEDHATTDLRLASAQRQIAAATSLQDVYELLASHDDGSTGVCNHHATLTTVYSYVLSRHRGPHDPPRGAGAAVLGGRAHPPRRPVRRGRGTRVGRARSSATTRRRSRTTPRSRRDPRSVGGVGVDRVRHHATPIEREARPSRGVAAPGTSATTDVAADAGKFAR